MGELTSGSHPIKASDIHIGQNKEKLLILLYSSKTHGRESRPQKVKIVANNNYNDVQKNAYHNQQFFCPFKIARQYLVVFGNYESDTDPFFIYQDQQPVKPSHIFKVLKDLLKPLNLTPGNYVFQGFRAGRAADLISFGYSIDQVRRAGRWRSNVVYKYIRNI